MATPIHYIFTEDPRYDAAGLRPLLPGDEYWLQNKETGELQKIGPVEVKRLFVKSRDELIEIIDKLVKKNASLEAQDIVEGILQREIDRRAEEAVKRMRFLRYRGEVDSIPETVFPGEVYVLDGRPYVVSLNGEATKLILEEDLQRALDSCCTFEEAQAKLDEVYAAIQEAREQNEATAASVREAVSKFVTVEEFIAKLSEYEQKVNEYRAACLEEQQKTRSNWEREIALLNAWKDLKTQEITRFYSKSQEKIAQAEGKAKQLEAQVEEFEDETNARIEEAKQQAEELYALVQEDLQKISTLSRRAFFCTRSYGGLEGPEHCIAGED